MAVPEGYVALGFVGFTDREEYLPDAIYAKNDLVHQDNTIWKCLIDGTTGIAPAPDVENWTVFIQSQKEMSGISVTDTFGVLGETGEVVVAQSFLDSLAEKVMNQMLTKSGLVNNALATTAGVAALDSAMGKTFQEQIDQTNSNLAFDAEGKKFQAGVNEFGFSYIRTVFPDGTIRQLQIQNDGTVESVFFDGNTWGLNWSSKTVTDRIILNEIRTRESAPNVSLIYYNNQGTHEGHFRLNINHNTFVDIMLTVSGVQILKTVDGNLVSGKTIAMFD